jgi:putative Holliday junction resolvase
MRILGLDLGARRIGLAISDPEGSIAFPVGTLDHKTRKRDIAALCEIIAERAVEAVVVGLPIHMSGRVGPEAENAKTFAKQLSEASGLTVDTIDERWTTKEANRALRETGRKGKKRKQVVDSVAASLLLRAYLDQRALTNDVSGPRSAGEPSGTSETDE